MKIKIRYFASLREIVKKDEDIFHLPDNATIHTIRTALQSDYPAIGQVLERCVYAVNKKYVPLETMLQDGDEVVFIPPMGGGKIEPVIHLTRQPLDRATLIEAVSHASVGGIVIFEGVVRDNARGKQVRYLEYEAYEEMAHEQIRTIIVEAQQRWGVERIAVAHRFGRLEIGEASVIIVVASPHRSEAFDACRYIIDNLKTRVPIWKKEVATNGEEWVEG